MVDMKKVDLDKHFYSIFYDTLNLTPREQRFIRMNIIEGIKKESNFRSTPSSLKLSIRHAIMQYAFKRKYEEDPL